MSLETNNQYISNQDQARKQEIQELRNLIPAVAAVAATRAILLGVDIPSSLKLRDGILENFYSPACTRRVLIPRIIQAQELCYQMAEYLNPKSRESNLGFQTRRLHLLSEIIKSNIAEGALAITATDLILGQKKFDVKNMQIIKEFKEQYL